WPEAPRPRGAEPPRPRTGHSAPGALRPWTRCRDPPHPARRRPGDPGSPGGSVRARSGSWARSTFRPCQLDHGQVPHLVVDVVGGGGRLAGGPLLAPAPGHLRADEVHRLAVGAGQQERTQRPPLSVELLRPVPEVEEDLL